MRRLIRFACGEDMLSGSIDGGARPVGLLCVTGGSQIRTGPHRMLHQIAARVGSAGYPAMRYDRRGVGDSDGADPGYLESGPDLAAAAAAFRSALPELTAIVGFGVCDGATTLALHGQHANLSGLALANPWLVEATDDEPAPAAARAHYRERFLSPRAWRDVLTGKVDLLGAAKSLLGAVAAPEDKSLATQVAGALAPFAGKLTLILARGDNTAITARACWNDIAFAHVRGERIVTIDTDTHTFARPGDLERVTDEVLALLHRVENEG
jgi:exosortase A-associated hydrolase 1